MSSPRTLKKYPGLVVLVMLIFFVISLITNILNSIIVEVRESFDLSLGMAGVLPFAFFIAYGVMSVPAGFLSERFDDRKLLAVSLAIIVLACLSFVFFPGFALFAIVLFVLGCAMAVMQVVINPMLRIAGGEAHFAFNSVLAQLVFGLASFGSPFLYMYLVGAGEIGGPASLLRSMVPEELPWVSLYLVFAAIAFVLWVIVWRSNYPDYQKPAAERAATIKSYRQLIRNKWTWLYFAGILCYVGIEQGVGNWISQFLLDYHGLDPKTTGAATVSSFWAMLTLGCLLGLLLLKLIDSRKVLVLSASAALTFLLVALSGRASTALWAFPAVGFSISVMWSVIFSLGLNSVKDQHGSLSGILCSGIAGGAVFPLIVGVIGDYLGLKAGMAFLLVPLFYILTIGFWAKPLIKNSTIKTSNSGV